MPEVVSEDNDGQAVSVAGSAVVSQRLIRLPEVIARVGLSRSSIYQRMTEGRFPKNRSLGPRCTVWVEAEIDAWIETVVSASMRA